LIENNRMKKLLLLIVVFIVGCNTGPKRQDYQAFMSEETESPFFYLPPLNQKDFASRTWILLAESKAKLWYYDPYTLSEDENGIVIFDIFFSPREQNQLAPYNATIVGPYRQKIDCFGNYQRSETLFTQNAVSKAPLVGDVKSPNGTGWVKIKPRTAMAYVRTRICGRKFIDDANVNYFLFQLEPMSLIQAKKEVIRDAAQYEKEKQLELEQTQKNSLVKTQTPSAPPPSIGTEVPAKNPPVFYEVINNAVDIIDAKKDVRHMRLSSYLMENDFPKQADYLFTANCQSNTYSMTAQGAGKKSSGEIGAKDSLPAIAFNRACADHGLYMKINSTNSPNGRSAK